MKARRTAAQQVWQQRLQRTGYVTGGGVAGAAGLSRRLEAAGVAGIIGSLWSQGWGVQKIFTAYTDRAPVLDIACEDYGRCTGSPKTNRVQSSKLTAESQALGEVPVFNVVGEIKGSQLLASTFMLSAHFDSWDGGSGATDNGTGTITMLEAMRILKQVYPNPRRTILVAIGGGEEQGLNGSRGTCTIIPTSRADCRRSSIRTTHRPRRKHERVGIPDAGASLARYPPACPPTSPETSSSASPARPRAAGTITRRSSPAAHRDSALARAIGLRPLHLAHNRDTYDKISWDDVKNNAALAAMLVYLASEDTVRMSRDKRTVFR